MTVIEFVAGPRQFCDDGEIDATVEHLKGWDPTTVGTDCWTHRGRELVGT